MKQVGTIRHFQLFARATATFGERLPIDIRAQLTLNLPQPSLLPLYKASEVSLDTFYHKSSVMSTFRATSRVARSLPVRSSFRQIRKESTTSSASPPQSGISHGLIGGLAGGGLVFLGGYTYYHFSGAKTLIRTAKQTEATFKSYTDQFKKSTPEFKPNESIEWLRSTAKSYAFMIPGASGYIDSAFDDIDAIRNKHGSEVDNIVKQAYTELKDVTSKEGMSFASAAQSWEILQKHLQSIAELAGDAGQDIMNNHPALKDKVGGNLDQLKKLGDKYGPEAKKQVEETTQQIKDIMKNGMRVDSIPKIQSLVQDKMQKVQEMGGELWDEGFEKAKPYLDKSPQVKEMIEKDKDALKKSGNVQELYNKIKDAVSSGSTDSLKQHIDKIKQGGGSSMSGGGSSGGLDSYLKMIPGGSQIMPKLGEMQELAKSHGPEAEKIAKDTFKEIEEVLKRKVEEAQKLAQDAQRKSS